ncbi:putative flippase GtrA [Bacillus mesophilus]|uniref:GtrA family protein n=1 Tax=Bacillus mesophilus TaxID=1808955 RepID=A0A6M0QBF4_9BACI|nr:GtrA family protein [Bacillus mesophilus]MBM7662982.1 putative flippase GtrA [Bacillus mesophilus]NEY73694.1 GtrA family protein [Bacillus mesophilus]
MRLVRNDFSLKFIKYSIVGVVNTAIYFISMFLLVEIVGIEPVVGSAMSFIVMTIFSFTLNKMYTFGGDFTTTKLVRFFIVSTLGFVLNYMIMFSIVTLLNFHYFWGELVTVLVIPLLNFSLNYFWTFK